MKRFAIMLAVLVLSLSCSEKSNVVTPIHAYGEVKPKPIGCLYMAFYAPTDDSHCKRSIFGRIKSVITPIDRVEPLLHRYTPKEFSALVAKPPQRDSQESRYIPGPTAWQHVNETLVSTDQVWSFGYLDSGFVVIRENKLLCMVVTCHSL